MGRVVPGIDASARMGWIAVALWVAVLGVSAWFAVTPVGQSLERALDGLHWRIGVSVQVDPRFVLVDIDERSLAIEGPWPWSRNRMADLVEALQDSGASQVTLDLMFPDAKAGDAELAERMRMEPSAVTAVTFALPGNEAVVAGELPDSGHPELCRSGVFPEAIGYVGQASSLGAAVGHIVPRVERDGVLRETPAFVCFENQAYPALALQAFLQASDLGGTFALRNDNGLVLVVDGVVEIPLTDQGGLRIPYHRAGSSFERVSASDVLAGITELEGRWVVVGSSAVGLSDRVSTPLTPLEAGAFAHIRLLGALLDQQFLKSASAAQLIFWLVSAVLAACLLLLSLIRQLRWWIAPVGVTLFCGLFFAVAGVMQVRELLLVTLSGPLAVLVGGGLASTALAFFQYRADQVALVGRLAAYLPGEVAARIARGAGLGSVDMRAQSGILMSLDLRNFDRWAEQLESNLTAALLHHYTTLVSDRVRAGGGQVLQVNGTRVRAFWSANVNPMDVLSTADALLVDVEHVFPDVGLDPELPPMALMIGIEAGSMLMGTYGSEANRGFTLLGDTPRVAQAMVRMSTELATPCVLGPEFAKLFPEDRLRSLGVFLLEESATPRELFEPAGGPVS